MRSVWEAVSDRYVPISLAGWEASAADMEVSVTNWFLINLKRLQSNRSVRLRLSMFFVRISPNDDITILRHAFPMCRGA